MSTFREAKLRQMELHERLEHALEILAGDHAFPDEDPVADDEEKVAALTDAELLRAAMRKAANHG